MRYVIAESFDKSEVNHFFEADIPPRIGETLRSRTGKLYRIKEIAWYRDPLDHGQNVRVLLSREQ